jgi:hypothetical protein
MVEHTRKIGRVAQEATFPGVARRPGAGVAQEATFPGVADIGDALMPRFVA